MEKFITFRAYVAVLSFGVSLGLLEAVVVIYLRALSGNTLFPLQSGIAGLTPQLAALEVYREAATLVIILVPAYLASGFGIIRALVYLLAFGTWDLAYYAFLRLFIGWPANLLTYDILFLIPRPWVAPVICPVAVAAALVVGSSAYLSLARNRMLRLPGPVQAALLALGAALMMAAFFWETEYYVNGGLPPRFAWQLFVPGYLLALVGGVFVLVQYARQPKARFF
jgi:hypothetical protein